jgi:DNA-binding SARP family transcriptional activator/tetratricopeptide (TPR) repeat protein
MDFRILGPLEVLEEGRPVALSGSKQRALLAVLLLHANEALTTDRLVDELWGERAPPTAAKAVHVHVSRLRKALAAGPAGDGLLVTRERGYELRLERERLDAQRFEQLIADGRSELANGRPQRALAAFERALSLWRGTPLADLAYEPFAQAEMARLEEMRAAALEHLVEAKLALGRHAEVVGELETLIGDHPYREPLRAQLMLALYRCDRQAEALQAYKHARGTLVDELGIEPGERLRELERAILAQDPALAAPPLGGAAIEPAPVRLPFPRPLRFPAGAPFVARERELARLHQLWRQVSATERAAVLVAGEAGIGKTRLAGELARDLQEDGALVLYGRCDEGLAVPYQPFVEALRPYASALGPERLRAELGPHAPQLGRLLPELRALGEPARSDPESERFALFEAVSALLEATTRVQPALLVLDDLHWAATPTLLMLRHLVRSERPLHALLVCTYRETELDASGPLAGVLADLQRDSSAHNLTMRGLDERGIAALLEAAAGHGLDARALELARALHTQTAGNPFFIRELLCNLVESGAIYRTGERWTTDLRGTDLEVPEGLRQVIRNRVARLSEPARQALSAATVVGPVFSLAVVERVLGHEDILDTLEEAVAAGLLVEAGHGNYAFAHALVRQALYAQLGQIRRMRLHRQVGEALEDFPDRDAHVEALAHHFAEAAADGQAKKAAAYALAAGRSATARLGYDEAAVHYERGLRAIAQAGHQTEEQRCDLLLALAHSRWSAGEIDKAREACVRAAELAGRHGDSARVAQAALSFSGPLLFEVGGAVTDRGVGLLRGALHALGDNDSALVAQLMGRLAAALAYMDPEQRRPALARKALEIARRVGDKPALADALATTHWATRGPDTLHECLASAHELGHVAHELGNVRFAAHAHEFLLDDLLELGDIQAVDRQLEALKELAEALRQRYPRWLVAMVQAKHAYLEGRLEQCEALAHEALSHGFEGQDESAAQTFAVQLLVLRREQGLLHELVEAVRGFATQYPEIRAWRCVLAYVYAELDRTAEARQELEALAGGDFRDLPRDGLWLLSMSALSEVIASVGDVRRAEIAYRLLLPYADRCVVTLAAICQGSASRALGILATTISRFDDAARHFDDALRMNARIRSPLWVAHTQHNYAQTLLQRDHPGDRENARILLGPALATADELGLTALAHRCQRLKYQADAAAQA